jgi:hypothetical protein
MLCCALAIVVAAYAKSTPHSSGFARLASEHFTKPSKIFSKKENLFCGKNLGAVIRRVENISRRTT